MAQDNTVSFKAYLLQGGTNEKSEVRRFGIDRDVVSSFDYLKEKLQHVFPTLRNQNFNIVWKDGDDDDVVISSDDELMIALSEMQIEVRKLYIKVLGTSAHSPNREAAGQAYEGADQIHKGVLCDVCDQQIEGFRYHCTVCFDYDLCGNCEAKKMHREHIMVRLPVSVPVHLLNPPLAQVMAAHLDAIKAHRGRDRRHHHGRGKWCHPNKIFDEVLFSYPDDLTREMFCSADEHKQPRSAEKGKQHVSAEEKRDKMKTKYEKFAKARGKKADYLWFLGHRLAEFLDPMGIAVDVDVLTRDENENKNEGKKGEEKMETEETEENEVHNKDPKCSAGEGSNEAGPSHAPEAGVAKTTAKSDCTNPESDDWTVLNGVSAEQHQDNHNADLNIASESTSDDDQTSAIEVLLDDLDMSSDTDDVEEIYIAGPCATGRKRKNYAEWREKHGCKKSDRDLKKQGHESDSESRRKHGHKRSGSESRKKNGHKRSGNESQRKNCYKRNISGNQKKHGHRSPQNSGNPPEAAAAATSVNQALNEIGKSTSSTAGVPNQAGATPVNQALSGTGEASTSRACMFPGVGTAGIPTSGTSAPMYAGLRTTGMPTSGPNVPIYAAAGATVPPAPGSYYTNLYPAIPNTNIPQFYIQNPNQPVQPRQSYGTYTRPHVTDAVQKMMAMGFSNEGGWLTQLLEIKNGDIEKALDVLQPVKRS